MQNTQPRIIGYTHNPDASGGFAHAVTEFGGGKPPVLACGLYGHAMDHVALHQEPQRELCAQCADIARVALLRAIVVRFGDGAKFSDAEAPKHLRELARFADAVLTKVSP